MNLESPDSGRRPPLEPVLPLINVVFLLLMIYSKVVLYCKHHDRSWRYSQLAQN